VHTFSVGFAGDGSAVDESADAERTARHLGSLHHHVLVTGAQVADQLEDFVRGLDQPSVDGLNSYFVSQAARRGVTVAISGTGGDELFAGYPWFAATVLEEQLLARPRARSALRRLAGGVLSAPAFDRLLATTAGAPIERLRSASELRARFPGRTSLLGVRAAQSLLARGPSRRSRSGRAIHHDIGWFDDPAAGTPLQRSTVLTLRGYTANQLLRDIDATSMAHSLEVRVPLLDPEVADMALSLPDAVKLGDASALADDPGGSYRDTGAKRILIDAHRSLLPPDIDRQRKRGFALPIEGWLRGPLAEPLADCLSERSVTQRGLLDPSSVSALAERFRRKEIPWTAPWLLMVLELWCREMIDQGNRGGT
jgi:asparagine synthase (glutamine-hydrolysing)